MLELLITVAAGIGGYVLARGFVRRRLRFVDAIHSPLAPVVAGVLAALIAWPAAALPVVTTGAAIAFGLGTALGTASGARAVRRAGTDFKRLTP
jgi:hypothetical protein